ncbi:unnamed protein product [Lasius platythorax]|uniref:Uncharacterized protein n=1 Tax=Lasius platythorax TaxID=488582 RepID=A0AAV2NTM8_9HYME
MPEIVRTANRSGPRTKTPPMTEAPDCLKWSLLTVRNSTHAYIENTIIGQISLEFKEEFNQELYKEPLMHPWERK